ncbi:MAG TPA: ABC transporter permease [Patescibacteria group bacterium]|nr:ABC transporter permease [Patescibacteria group bacterium]
MGGVSAPPADAVLSDTSSLKTRLRRAERMRKVTAFGLVAPLLLFIVITFVVPIGSMLWRSVDDSELSTVMPHTLATLKKWDGHALPGDESFRALAADLTVAHDAGTANVAARRLNYDINGLRSLIMTTARKVPALDSADPRAAFIGLDPRWGDIATWGAIKRARGPLTDFYLLAAVDLQRDATGAITRTPADHAIYQDVLIRTFRISLTVTLLSLVLGFPVAYLLSTQPAKIANILLILVLLPFWTSLLVRTAAWVVLLQNEGIVNHLLIWLGIIDHPLRLIYNSFGVHVAMVHVLLPFMILPLYATMKAISPVYMRAAASLGAPPATAFLRVYLPQCLPGIAAGCLVVFILSIGYYITPALVGGAADQMLSYFIAFFVTDSVNWGMASALGAVLLTATLVLYAVYSQLVASGSVRMKK